MQLNINGKTIEVSNDDLKQALEENKETFDLKSDLIVRTQEEENIFSTNIRKEGQSSGAEFGRKNVLKSLGIEGEGLHKSDEKSLEAINNLINTKLEQGLKDANIEPNKKVEELLKDKEILQTQLQERNKAFSEFELKVGQERKENYIKSSIMSLIPDNTVIEKESIYTLITNNNINGIKFDVDENNQIFGIGSDGQPIKDSNASKKDVSSLITSIFDKNPSYLKGATGGAGGGDSTRGGGIQTLGEFTKEMNKKGISNNSEEFNRVMMERQGNGTLEKVV